MMYAESTGFTMPGNAVTVTARIEKLRWQTTSSLTSTGTIMSYHVEGAWQPERGMIQRFSIHGTA